MNNYKKYYLVCLEHNDNWDIDFTNKQKALYYARELRKDGKENIRLHIYKGTTDDQRAYYISTINL